LIGGSGIEEIMFPCEAELFDQFPTEIVLLTLAMNVSFLDVRLKADLRVDI